MNDQTILAVDDEAHILQVVSLKLRNAGYNVLTAKDGEEALEIAAAHPLHLLITDFQMPGMSGLELAAKLHHEPGRRLMPILLLTAHGLALEQVETSRAGITVRLAKPFSPRELLETVQKLLQERTPATAPEPQLSAPAAGHSYSQG
jgi:two-component system, OmpR family, alkaline phosphatase synthesis response regulator PhoP